MKLEPESSISPETEKTFEDEAWKFAEFQGDGFYLLTNLDEIRLYPARRIRRNRALGSGFPGGLPPRHWGGHR